MFYELRWRVTHRLATLNEWLNDLIKWARPGMHVKRWLGLLLFALTCTALGIAFFLVEMYRTQPFPAWVYWLTLQFLPRVWRGVLFLGSGAALGGFALYQFNRSLVAAVQPPYTSERLVDLVYNYRLPQRRPTVVAFAGHRGFVALQARRHEFARRLVAISSVAERSLPPDLQDQLPAHATESVLLPTRTPVELCAELQHGTVLKGAEAIRARRSGVPIKRIFLVRDGQNPDEVLRADGPFVRRLDCEVNPEVLAVIHEADIVLFGPGSFYLAVVSNLLLRPIADALQTSRAKKVLITNLMTEPGQTDDFGLADFIRAIHLYGGFYLDYALVNTATADRTIQDRYAAVLAQPVLAETEPIRAGPVLSVGRSLRKLTMIEGVIVVGADLATKTVERVALKSGPGELPGSPQRLIVLRHDPEKLAAALIRLLGVNAPASVRPLA